MNNAAVLDVEVLVVGGGAAGLTSAMLLAQHNVNFLLVSYAPGTSQLPKAHVLYQKTMEIFAELGVADAIYAIATPPDQMRYNGWYAGFAGDGPDVGRQITRIECWGAGDTHPAWRDASPRQATNLPQIRLEPILKARADAAAPGKVRFNHALVSLTQDAAGVAATIEDRASGERYQVRAKYLLGCDGGRTVGEAVGIALEGQPNFATQVSVHFSADLSRWTSDDPEVLIRVIKNPDTGDEAVLVPMGPLDWGPASQEWSCGLGMPPGMEVTDAAALARMRQVLGIGDHPLTVHRFSRWAMQGLVAPKFRAGRVFLLGDAAHRHPPTGGLGLNTAVQDAYNLCWKLAAVLRGKGTDALLDSYEDERLPVARLVVETSVQNAFKLFRFNETIGFDPQAPAADRWAALRAIWDDDPAHEPARQRLFDYFAATRSEFDSLNITFGYTYRSAVIAPDGDLPPLSPDNVCIYRPTTQPGASIPAAELCRLRARSTLEQLTGNGHFTLVVGSDGELWRAAAEGLTRERGLSLDVVSIGVGGADWIDWRFDWARKSEIGAGGALLVRPDRFIAWRSLGGATDPTLELSAAVDIALGHALDVA